MEDFWNRLLNGHTQGTAKNALDHGLAFGEDFEGVRSLTDAGRAANALRLPVTAGTRVSFRGNLGAMLSYENPPLEGSVGEVVTVRSANGDITDHGGLVFVKWADGQFRPVHAEHLKELPPAARKEAVVGDPTNFLGRIPREVTRIKCAGLGDLTNFLKVSNNTLVHKSTQDLWAFNKDADGGFVVERLFTDTGNPLKE